MRGNLANAARPVDIDRVVNATITLMSVLIVYDGWQQLRFIGVVGVIVGPMLAVYISHVFATTLTQQLALGRALNIAERMTIARSEPRFLLICVPLCCCWGSSSSSGSRPATRSVTCWCLVRARSGIGVAKPDEKQG